MSITAVLRNTRITTGTYTGNDSANRAISHGLGMIPKWVYISVVSGGGFKHVMNDVDSDMLTTIGAAGGYNTLPMTTSEFYVGNATSYANSANAAATDYAWLAIGGS